MMGQCTLHMSHRHALKLVRAAVFWVLLLTPQVVFGQSESAGRQDSAIAAAEPESNSIEQQLWRLLPRERLASSAQLAGAMVLIGLIPALLLMTTSYVRIAIILSILRQAFGVQQLIPAQVTTALAMFCTGLIMWPTWSDVYEAGVQPLMNSTSASEIQPIWDAGVQPIRSFMIDQIRVNDNAADVHLFLRHTATQDNYPSDYEEVPLRVLLPAFLTSELKTAFLMGFKIYLPFLVIDLIVAALATSLGMFMLPPTTVSLPLKLLLFVSVDGWHLVFDMLLQSFR